MKGILAAIFWIGAAAAGWRFIGPTIDDFGDRLTCRYKNSHDDCLTQLEYIKMVSHDAAVDALSDRLAYCSSYQASSDPSCAAFHHQ
jgi:hypothetical protein